MVCYLGLPLVEVESLILIRPSLIESEILLPLRHVGLPPLEMSGQNYRMALYKVSLSINR